MGRRALGSMAMFVVLGCGPGAAVRPVPTPLVSPSPPEQADASTREKEGRTQAPDPAVLEGTIFRHCAYGPPNFGEDPQTDSKEPFGLLVLDQPLRALCASDGREPECVENVTMLQVAPTEQASTLGLQTILGRHLRVVVAEYSVAITGHHHTRMLLGYDKLDDLGPAERLSLRASWPKLAHDFLGTSCAGHPE